MRTKQIWKIGDCLELLPELHNNSIDCVITSPPYEDISGAGYTGAKKDILFFKLYSQFINDLFLEYHRVLKDTGQIFFNIKSKTHNTALKTPHWIEFTEAFSKFKLKSYIIWKYAGSFDSTNKRLHLDYEIIYHLSKTDDVYLNENCGIKDPLSSVWYIPHTIKKRLHPTQMPIAVVERILKIATKEGDWVLDTFAGSGTTLKACQIYNRNCIGFELNPEYEYILKKRLMDDALSLETRPDTEAETINTQAATKGN